MIEEKKITVLYVDDEIENLNSFKANFRRDFNIITALSATAALEILSLKKEEIQVVLTDQKMPGISGVEFLSILIDQYPDPIRILVTGYADIQAVVDSINQGKVFSYVSKPWDYNGLKRIIDEASSAYLKRKEKEEELNHFIYKAAHDLKGPIVSIREMLTIAQESSTNKEELDQMLYLIKGSINSLEFTLDDLIDYKNIDNNTLRNSEINFEDMIKSILIKYHDLYEFNGLNVSTTVQSIKTFKCDKEILESILSQVIMNAIKYRKPNDSTSFLNINITANIDEANIVIEDNGVGMSEGVLKKAFSLFFRGHKGIPGSGLGLYIVKKGVERMNGNLKVQSSLSEGTKFSVTIPNSKSSLLKRENVVKYTVL